MQCRRATLQVPLLASLPGEALSSVLDGIAAVVLAPSWDAERPGVRTLASPTAQDRGPGLAVSAEAEALADSPCTEVRGWTKQPVHSSSRRVGFAAAVCCQTGRALGSCPSTPGDVAAAGSLQTGVRRGVPRGGGRPRQACAVRRLRAPVGDSVVSQLPLRGGPRMPGSSRCPGPVLRRVRTLRRPYPRGCGRCRDLARSALTPELSRCSRRLTAPALDESEVEPLARLGADLGRRPTPWMGC